MRTMSFGPTAEQILKQTKTVTRRIGWRTLKPGDLLQPVVKAQRLKHGEKVERIGPPIRVVRVDLEWTSEFLQRDDAASECAREGFPEMSPREFHEMFRDSLPHRYTADILVTRIEFE